MSPTKIFSARRIITMDPDRPQATHVAVRDGRILAVGTLDDVRRWGPADIDDRYASQVLMPGLVEGHSHAMAGSLWRFVFVGFHPRTDPSGRIWEGCGDFDQVVQRLQRADRELTDPHAPLLAWGFDPIFFGSERMSVRHLDQVSTTRPVVILHASQHLMNVNSAALAAAGIDRDSEIEGIARFGDGSPTGELQEFAAMFPIQRLIANQFRISAVSPDSLRMFGQLAVAAGVTTATDLVNELSDESMAAMQAATGADDYPIRLVPAFASFSGLQGIEGSIERVRRCAAGNTDKLHCGLVKIVADGSIQGFTARVRWPGYFNGHDNGIWIFPPADLKRMIASYHAAGLQLHIHTNGDEATEVVLDALQAAQDAHPRADHRHTLQHCQMADAAQFRRMRELGVCANLFANHIFYWGDAHLTLTMGPDRAERMDACATALRHGVPLAIHSDAPITPMAPLFTAWCAVNRMTSSGHLLGAEERIGVADALHAITLGAAWTLKMDHLVGSIEVGKYADFCVLDDDPLQCEPMALKDVRVAGTVLGGRPMPHPARQPA